MPLDAEDVTNPTQEVVENNPAQPIELPDGLSIDDVQNKAIKWNSEWKLMYDTKKTRWESNLQLYKRFTDALVENISTQTHEIWATIQSEKPFMTNSILTKSEIVKAKPKFLDAENKAFKVNHFVNRLILSNLGRKTIKEAVEDFLVFGTTISKVHWDSEELREFNVDTQEWFSKYEGKPAWYNVDIFNFGVDPSFVGSDLNKANWLRERTFYTKHEIIDLAERGEIIPVDEFTLASSKDVDSGDEVRRRLDGDQDIKSEKVFIDEFWATFYWKVNGKQQTGKYYFWLLNNSKVVKFKKNVFSSVPFYASRCYPQSHQFWGLGDVDIMASLSEHIDTTHTQGAYLAKQQGQKLILIEKGSGIDPQQLKSQVNGILVVADRSKIGMEDTTAGRDLPSLLEYNQSLKADLSNVVGVNSIMRGEPLGDATATEASILNSNASARLSQKLANFQDEYIVPLAKLIFDFSKQFTDTFSFYIDNQIIQLKQIDFQGEYEWEAQGSTALANRQLRIKTMAEYGMSMASAALQAAQANGAIKFPVFNWGLWNKNEVMSIMEVQNPEQYFSDSPQPMEASQQAPEMPVGGGASVPTQIPLNDTSLNEGTELGNMEGDANNIVS